MRRLQKDWGFVWRRRRGHILFNAISVEPDLHKLLQRGSESYCEASFDFVVDVLEEKLVKLNISVEMFWFYNALQYKLLQVKCKASSFEKLPSEIACIGVS